MKFFWGTEESTHTVAAYVLRRWPLFTLWGWKGTRWAVGVVRLDAFPDAED